PVLKTAVLAPGGASRVVSDWVSDQRRFRGAARKESESSRYAATRTAFSPTPSRETRSRHGAARATWGLAQPPPATGAPNTFRTTAVWLEADDAAAASQCVEGDGG